MKKRRHCHFYRATPTEIHCVNINHIGYRQATDLLMKHSLKTTTTKGCL